MDKMAKKGKKTPKKALKERNLFNAAFELFTSKGINKTAIDDIVKKAGVAKGTFYLYFKDKYDIMDRIVLNKSSNILLNAIKATENRKNFNPEDYVGNIIFLVDYIIEHFKKDKGLLKLIYKNLSWGVYRKAFEEEESYKEVREKFEGILKRLNEHMEFSVDNIEKIMFMVIELVGSVCYSSIILKEPDTIDEMKPILFEMIKKMLT